MVALAELLSSFGTALVIFANLARLVVIFGVCALIIRALRGNNRRL